GCSDQDYSTLLIKVFIFSSVGCVLLLFFFLMIRRPPRSTLFPYTTPSDLGALVIAERGEGRHEAFELHSDVLERCDVAAVSELRSEEHTSELQSQSNLVCRLLLEKKKKKSSTPHPSTTLLPPQRSSVTT